MELLSSCCPWAEGDPLMRAYHDEEWGVPQLDSHALWEALVLDGFQAGLSWLTILRKREAFRDAFDGFDPATVARLSEHDVDRLMRDEGIIRSRPKILAAIGNARAYLAMEEAGEDLASWVWSAAGGEPREGDGHVVALSPLSEALAAALKARGFKFVGPVVVHAWLQAIGVLNDHVQGCPRREAVRAQSPF